MTEPGHPILHLQDVLQVAHPLVAENQAGQVDSEKAAAADLVGRGKDHDGTAGNQQGVQARGQGNAVDQPDQAKAARQTA